MMKSKQAFVFRILALVLALFLLIGAFPVGAIELEDNAAEAAGQDASEYTQPATQEDTPADLPTVDDDAQASEEQLPSEMPTEDELAPVGSDPVQLDRFVAVIYCEAAGTDDASRTTTQAFDSEGKLTYDFVGEAYVFVRNTDNDVQYLTEGWTDKANPVTLLKEDGLTSPDKLYVPKGKNVLTLSAGEDDTFTLGYEAAKEPETAKPEPTDAPFKLADGFYMIRPDWQLKDIDTAEKLDKNPADSDEWMVNAKLAEDDSFKVVKIEKNAIKTWYPDGTGNEYVVDADHAGNREVYFRESPKSDWDDENCGGDGYIYVEKDKDVQDDTAAPVLSDAKYYKNGDALSDIPEWVKYEDKISVSLKATDADPSWGIDEYSFTVDGKNINVTRSGERYIVPLAKKKAVTVKVKDKAHNESSGFETVDFNVDEKAPTAGDISCLFFKKEDAVSKLLKALTFGIYSDDTTSLKVTVTPNGGSPIDSLILKDGETVLEPVSTEKKDGSLIATFDLPKKNDQDNKENNKYNLVFSSVKDKAGYEAKDIKLTDTTLKAESEEAVPSGDFDIVVTDLAPDCDVTVTKSDKSYTTDDKTYYKGAVTFGGTVTDITSISRIETYFDTADKIQKDSDGKYDLSAIAPINHKIGSDEASATDFGTDAKVTSKDFTVSVPADKASGVYKLLVAATNIVEKTSYTEVEVTLDNTAPEVKNVSFDTKWTNEPVDVSFTVSDAAPSAGIKGVNVKGPDNNSVTVAFKDGAYHFDVQKNGVYKITATDNLDSTGEVATADVKNYDNVKPQIKNLTYNGEAKQNGKWSKDPVKVAFDVTDDLSGINDATLTVLPVRAGADTAPEKIKLAIKDGKCSFEANYQSQYKINIKDNATNAAEEVTTEEILYDPNGPEFNKVVFRSAKYRKFGVYSNEVIYADVYVKSEGCIPNEIGSDVAEITAADNGEPLEAQGGIQKVDGELLRYRTFILPPKAKDDKSPYKLSFYTKKGNSMALTISSFADFKDGVYVKDGETLNLIENSYKSLFEIVVTQAKPGIADFAVNMTTQQSDEGVDYYSGSAGTVELTLHDDFAGIDAETVELSIENTSTGAKKDIKSVATFSGKSLSNQIAAQVDAKITELAVSYDISKFLSESDTVLPSGLYRLTAKVKNYAGNDESKTYDFWVDNTKPEILTFDFTDDPDHKAIDTENAEVTRYGYFFKDETTVRVNATDVINGIKGVGIKQMVFWADSLTQLDSHSVAEMKFEGAEITKDGDNVYVDIPVSAGFKGKLYAYAVDKFDFKSETRSPSENGTVADGLILEKQDQHDASSGAKIDVLTAPVNKDVRDNNLYNTAVDVQFTVHDLFSGIQSITYTVTDYDKKVYEGTTKIDKDMNVDDSDALGGYAWTITGTDKNLATELTKTITLDTGRFDCNFIEITLTATDNCGFETNLAKETLSIDTKPPVLEIVYNPVKSAAQNSKDGYEYYNTNRTATITVTERNFDPADFDVTQFIAVEGTLPAIVGTKDWSREYNDYLDTTTHIAEITFAEDGKFDVDFDYTDLAKNKANDIEKESFIIDKTKPVMTVTLQNSASPRYSQSNRATIKIVEHNFDPDSAHFTYTPTATGPDYASAGTAPQVGAWSTTGDEHTATIDYPGTNEGKFSFKVTFKDLAENAADEHNEPDFYIDSHADKPEFDAAKVKEHYAYDGEIAPAIIYTDHSFNASNYSYKLTRHAYDFEKMEQVTEVVKYADNNVVNKNSATGLDSGARVDYDNFPNQEIADGIYTLYAEYTDLANNHAENSITFSVNRFGSVFLLGSVETTDLVEREYTSEAPDVYIREISAIQHKGNSVSLSYNSSSKTLTDSNYKVTSPNTVGKWYEYMYDVFKNNFNNEGEYTVTVTSEYSIGGKEKDVTNRTANTDGKVERNCPVSFVVDKTVPTVSISGVEDGMFYSEAEKTLQIVCTDDNIDYDSLVVTLDGQVLDLEAYGATVDDSLFGEIDVELPIAADGKETQHSIKVDVRDLAGNGSDGAINAFTLSATFLTMFFHNTVALIISGAVLAALIALGVILIVKKRKNSAN